MNTAPSTRRQFLHRSVMGAVGTMTATSWAQTVPDAKPKIERFSHYDDAVLVKGELPPISADSFTLVALPDTQKYAKVNPEAFLEQTHWIVENARKRNIAGVLHLGDITDNNLPAQWELAQRAMNRLDGEVPYFMALGNHDYSEGGSCSDRTTLFNNYFPLSKHGKHSAFGGVYDKEPDRLENSFHLISAGGRELLVLCLEFGPRKDVVRWANEVVSSHPKRGVILVTHAYMYFDDTRFDWKGKGEVQNWNPHKYKMATATGDDVSDGEELWQNLVSKHSNFLMTVNGHVLEDGLGRLTSEAGGRQIHQMLFNCQMRPNGGDGWMRLIEFKPTGTVEVCDYSPTLKARNEAPENKFSLQLA